MKKIEKKIVEKHEIAEGHSKAESKGIAAGKLKEKVVPVDKPKGKPAAGSALSKNFMKKGGY